MKHLFTVWAAAAVAAFSLAAAAQNAPKPAPNAARAAAASASGPGAAAEAAGGSPAVQAAERARMPGELGPDKPAVPQIAVPLPGRRAAGPAASAAAAATVPGGIDDDAARCTAIKSKSQRQACRARVAASAPRH